LKSEEFDLVLNASIWRLTMAWKVMPKENESIEFETMETGKALEFGKSIVII